MDDQSPTTAAHAGADAIKTPGGSVSGLSAIGSMPTDAEGRSVFAADELAIVLSHYRIGLIDTIKQFNRGSRKAPKLVIRSDLGLFLLKRRAHGRDDPFKVAFTHGIQLRLGEQGFPLPRLIGTRRDNNSMVQYLGQVYELFEFVRGTGYDRSVQATQSAGATLAKFHTLLADYKPHFKPPKGTYHAAPVVISSLSVLTGALMKPATGDPAVSENEANQITDALDRIYNDAADRADELGLTEMPMQVGHSDWHPGNMLFNEKRVVAVIDYDAARLLPRVIDVANGALQFSIQGRGEDTGRWPEQVDEDRFEGFFQGYRSVTNGELTRAEKQTVPWLMIQALVAESVIPVAATGMFSSMNGADFLKMVLRKVHWIQANHTQLIEMIDA